MAKQISARIDSQSKVLYARQVDQRTATFAAAIKMGEEYMRDTKALLLRINLMRADFIVKGSGEGPGFGPSKSSRGAREGGRFHHHAGDAGFHDHAGGDGYAWME